MAKREVQRRLAAIVSADVVAYTRLMERDEVGTHARLKARFKALVDPKIDRCLHLELQILIECRLLATSRLSGHVASTSAYPPAPDILDKAGNVSS